MKAFPLNSIDEKNFLTNQGMDLRDYFAAKAIQGICAGDWKFDLKDGTHSWIEVATLKSYEIADAMIKARDDSTKE
jgi:hypothetical protein